MYNRLLKENVIVVPLIKLHPVPNVEHCMLHSFTSPTLIASLVYALAA